MNSGKTITSDGGTTVSSAGTSPSDGTTLSSAEIPPANAETLTNLPSRLAATYEIEQTFDARGGEADIILVKRRSDPQQKRIVKLYRQGRTPNPAVLEALFQDCETRRAANNTQAPIVELFDYAMPPTSPRAYELQEYIEHGSLKELLARRGRPPAAEAKIVLRQINDALAHLQALPVTIVHRDLKPGNILIRQPAPLAVALADFGIASQLEFTEADTDARLTYAYAPPEAHVAQGVAVVSRKYDFWSLGIVIIELLTGRMPFAEQSNPAIGKLLHEEQPIDLEAIRNDPALRRPREDWARLCRGLLQYDPDLRWGAAEIGRWLEGDAIALPEACERWLRTGTWTEAIRNPPNVRPYRFIGRDFRTLRDLVESMVLNWDAAIIQIKTRRAIIQNWLHDDLDDHVSHDIFFRLMESGSADQQFGYFADYVLKVPELQGVIVDDAVRKTILQTHLGLAAAQLDMARQMLSGTLPMDLDRALALARAALAENIRGAAETVKLVELFQNAERGDRQAQYELGDNYYYGRGVKEDHTRGAEWYRKAAEHGHADAQYNLGVMHAEGRGVEPDDAKAVKWFRKAAEQEHADAQYNLGWMYQNGRGVGQNDAEAVKWYRKAAKQGQANAKKNLDLMCQNGRGVPLGSFIPAERVNSEFFLSSFSSLWRILEPLIIILWAVLRPVLVVILGLALAGYVLLAWIGSIGH